MIIYSIIRQIKIKIIIILLNVTIYIYIYMNFTLNSVFSKKYIFIECVCKSKVKNYPPTHQHFQLVGHKK